MPIENYVTYERVQEAVAQILPLCPSPPKTAILLGSGLSSLTEAFEVIAEIDYGNIPHFPVSSAPFHQGKLIIARQQDQIVLMMSGRFHLYEGWLASEIAFPIYVLKALGVTYFIVTNAAGALSPDYRPGDVMILSDHLNLTGQNPLIGQSDQRLGLRFPDMSDIYPETLRHAFMAAMDRHQTKYHQGIYAGISGPSLETSAERRFLRQSGADAVGMSTVTEVIAAGHAGLSVLGLSAITNMATGGPEQQPDTIEEVVENAARAGQKMIKPIQDLIMAVSSAD